MKIAVLTSSYPRFTGDGTAPFIQSICEALAQQGHRVEVAAPFDPAVKLAQGGLVKVQRFRYIYPDSLHVMGHARSLEADVRLRPLSYLLLPLFVAASTMVTDRLVRSMQADILHVNWVLPNGPAGAWVSGGRHVPMVVSLHGSDIYVAERNALFRKTARSVFSRARAVVACSPDLRERAVSIGAAPAAQVLPYGINPEKFHPGLRSPQVRKQYGFGESTVLIAALGRMVHKKGFNILLDAFSQVPASGQDARLIIGGDGPLKPELIQQAKVLGISERVIFPGRIDWDQTPVFLASADIFVLPSVIDAYGNMDGLPNVLMEAMACGRPVVASSIGGVPLVVDSNRNGLLVEPGKPEALALAIGELVAHPDQRQQLGKVARSDILEHHTWEKYAQQFTKILESSL
jgi:glycosyltransferase involved in cell wall biosynthesis